MSSDSVDPTTTSAAAMLDQLLVECAKFDASDVHLVPGMPPYFRVAGQLAARGHAEPLSAEMTEQIAAELARRARRQPLEQAGSLDGAVTGADRARFRFNVFRRQGQLAIAIRQLEDRFRSLSELGLQDHLYSLCDLPDGLVVVAGPTGAGKSTTLAALIDRVNRTRRCHIVTIEDPIEYLHLPIRSLVNQRQVGSDTDSFYDALVASLRQDPDVILVGEIRDLNTIRTAIAAAETGHLVFTTVHAGDCVGAIERMVSVFPADEQLGIRRQLSLVLRSVIAQHLVICDGTAAKARASLADSEIASGDGSDSDANPVRRQRVVASEVLYVSSAVANLIATSKTNQIYSAMETGGQQGMHTLEESLARLWAAGQISEATASTLARNPTVVRDRYLALRPAAAASVARSMYR